jgi:hypothetical protein
VVTRWLDSHLAALYEVPTKRLNEAVKRNAAPFPQKPATSNEHRGGRRYLPYVFTEQGVAMLSTILNSERAIVVNIAIMRRSAPPVSHRAQGSR